MRLTIAVATLALAMASVADAKPAQAGPGGGNGGGNGGGGGNGATIAVIANSCISVAHANGCMFSGNIAPTTVAATQNAYNLYNDLVPSAAPDIVLNYLGKSDSGFGSFTGTTTGTWATPGFTVDFLAVKAGDNFVLYKLPAPASSGLWNTFNLTNGRGTPQALSHLAFFGTPGDIDTGGNEVPEPATWAMLLAGFGMVGFASRRRRRAAAA